MLAVWFSTTAHLPLFLLSPELNAIRRNEIVRNSLHNASRRLESVDLRPDDWFRAEVLPVAVARVGEPEVSGVVILLDIVQAREVAAIEIVDQDASLFGRRVDQCEPGSIVEVALVAEHDLLAFTAVARRADRVEGRASVGFRNVRVADRGDFVVAADVNGSDVDRVVKGAVPIACSVEQPGLDVVDTSFVESIP